MAEMTRAAGVAEACLEEAEAVGMEVVEGAEALVSLVADKTSCGES